MINISHKTVNISNIIVPTQWIGSLPKTEKITSCYDNYRNFKQLDREIVIDDKYVLQDGYVALMIAKAVGESKVKVLMISEVAEKTKSVEPYSAPSEPEQKKETVKLYCVKDYCNFLTKGKIYEFDGFKVNYDNIEPAKFKSFDDWKRNDPSFSSCLCEAVKRPAKVGEYILITSWISGNYKNGDIGKVEKLSCFDGDVIAFNGAYVDCSEYLVLSNYTPEEPKEEYYNGKVVCVSHDATKPFELTDGKVYAVINGAMKLDDGYTTKCNRSLYILGVALYAKFIEFKGEI